MKLCSFLLLLVLVGCKSTDVMVTTPAQLNMVPPVQIKMTPIRTKPVTSPLFHGPYVIPAKYARQYRLYVNGKIDASRLETINFPSDLSNQIASK
jgi:hypothetical protein